MSRSALLLLLARVTVTTLCLPSTASAQLTTVDFTNFGQNLITALESVDQTLTMIEDYKAQLLQVDEMVRNGVAPGVYVWDKVDSIQRRIRNLKGYTLDAEDYLRKFGDLDYYRGADCYQGDLRCPERTWDRLVQESIEAHGFAADSFESSIDGLVHAIDASDEDLQAEAENLRQLQQQAEAADGHMKALQAANQLAASQAQQLMQMRAAMVAMYQMMGAEARMKLDEQLRREAAGRHFRRDIRSTNRPRETNAIWVDGLRSGRTTLPERSPTFHEEQPLVLSDGSAGEQPPRSSWMPAETDPLPDRGAPLLPRQNIPPTDVAPLPPRQSLEPTP